jgi:hypothetical protein
MVLSQHFPRGADENHEKLQSGAISQKAVIFVSTARERKCAINLKKICQEAFGFLSNGKNILGSREK